MHGPFAALARQNRIHPAERLRDLAAACRDLSSVERTLITCASSIVIALQFEANARQIFAAAHS
jgi:hypothetical protein